jgi:hypothetical protein
MVLDVKMQIHPIVWLEEETTANDELGAQVIWEHFDYDSHHFMYVLGPNHVNIRPSKYVLPPNICATCPYLLVEVCQG